MITLFYRNKWRKVVLALATGHVCRYLSRRSIYFLFPRTCQNSILTLCSFVWSTKLLKLHHVAYKCWICSLFLEQSRIVIQKRIISFEKIYIIQFYLGSKTAGETNTYFVHCDLSDGFRLWNFAILEYYKPHIHILHIFVWIYLFGCNIRQILEHTFDLSTHKM